ncbi:zf-HC2 domain-containing protein [Phenylobacterium sp. LjRoot219]|uniref:zf-HC2 domain-containing protein n=1 Tax=Phenylobacterium sp. LjRoot219 TaxID=3342283 RepID=UPI003ED027A7
MDKRINPPDEPEHRNAQLHLPWYATGRLDAAEQARVAMHVAGCAACQADLALEGALADQELEPPAVSADAGWARLKSRLDRERRPTLAPAAAAGRRTIPALFGDWRGWAIAAQFALIVLLTILLTRAPPASDYQTLGRPQPSPGGDLLVMFKPDTPERTIRALLGDARARVVDGPTVTGAYVLQIPDDEEQLALARLRESPAVTLAEPLAAEPAP